MGICVKFYRDISMCNSSVCFLCFKDKNVFIFSRRHNLLVMFGIMWDCKSYESKGRGGLCFSPAWRASLAHLSVGT